MTNTTAARTDVVPSATIGEEAEIAAWNALPRDEQVRRYQEALAHPACDTITDDSMSDILAAARLRVATPRRPVA